MAKTFHEFGVFADGEQYGSCVTQPFDGYGLLAEAITMNRTRPWRLQHRTVTVEEWEDSGDKNMLQREKVYSPWADFSLVPATTRMLEDQD